MTGQTPYPVLMRTGQDPRQAVGKPLLLGPDHDVRVEAGMRIERNLRVPMRDGVEIYIDVYRPAGSSARSPAILGWSPYGKHNLSNKLWPAADVNPDWLSSRTAFEAVDPVYWTARGYAVVYPDPRGTWWSPGEMSHGGLQESQDCCDLIEWLGEADWSNGKVGLSGVSYLAAIQWQVAPLRPKHLAAINPWEGFSDWYREFGLHGGMPETGFCPNGCARLNWSTTRTEDTAANMRAHPLFDDYWRSKETDLEAIVTPALVVAGLADSGLHLRGTLEGFRRMSSPQKWLELHGRKKWSHYYHPESVVRLGAFFDHFLKDEATGVTSWPRVRLEVRETAAQGEIRAEAEWPLARTIHTPLYLDAARGSIEAAPVRAASEIRYDATEGEAVFEHLFARETELTGYMSLRLWVEAEGSDDMDLFVAVQKLDAEGRIVPFVYYAFYDTGPAALGWLRASHRELDPVRSSPGQPVHPHTREERLEAGVPVPVDIEIWPSATLFRAGERLRLVVAGHDLYQATIPGTPFCLHQDTRNRGTHILHTGGAYDSHLLVPVIPKA
ncbi:MAG: CocE/NonD family hydrolase [Phenylobacterium sp.]